MSWRDPCVTSMPHFSISGGGIGGSSYYSTFIPAPTPAPRYYTSRSYEGAEGPRETSAKQLMQILHSTKTSFRPLPGYENSSQGYDRITLGLDCDEVYPNLFIGDAGAARNKSYLRRIGITHVVNTAEGNRFGMVNTDSHYYRDSGIRYLGLPLLDIPSTNIREHFNVAADFVDDGIKSGGKVLVHCLMGMSRSSTIALAYLMLKVGLPAPMALRMCRQHRDIRPNDGFLQQLADLDNRMRHHRERAPMSYSSRGHRL